MGESPPPEAEYCNDSTHDLATQSGVVLANVINIIRARHRVLNIL